MSRDRMDVVGVSWHDALAQLGEACVRCHGAMRRGSRILVERLLPGVPVKPLALHRRCWPEHLAWSEKEARRRQAEKKALDTEAPTA